MRPGCSACPTDQLRPNWPGATLSDLGGRTLPSYLRAEYDGDPRMIAHPLTLSAFLGPLSGHLPRCGGRRGRSTSFPDAIGRSSATSLLSVFLNNVVGAIIMGPLAIDAAVLLCVDSDVALLAVLIDVSSAFLTPTGHQNGMLVARLGGYALADDARMGLPLAVLVVGTTAPTRAALND